jgi:hypothetical protein
MFQRQHGHPFWRGTLLSVLEVVPYTGVQTWMFEHTRNSLPSHFRRVKYPTASVIGSACVAAVCAAALTYPFVLVRRNQMAHNDSSTSQTFRTVYGRGGFRAFYRGFPLHLVSIVPSVTVAMISFNWLKNQT